MISAIVRLYEGCNISSPDKSVTWRTIITGFVDDNRQHSNDWENDNTQVILNNFKVST